LEESVGALRIRLSADKLKSLDEITPPGAAAGNRYPEGMMKLVDR
jgi:hypothetical protein